MITSSKAPTVGASNPWLRLMRMDRPIGVYLLLWPTLWGLWFAAEGAPSSSNLAIFIVGLVVMRAAGCVINDYADRHVDGLVERTKTRPLPAGEIKPKHALILCASLLIAALILVLQTNQLTILLSFGGVAVTAVYPFMKRFTNLPQMGLGVAWAWAIPMGFAAERGGLPNELWLLFAAVVVWTVAFDTYYAMVDRDDDVQIGIKSTAILFGRHDRTIIAILQIATLGLLVFVGVEFGRGWIYYAGLTAAAGYFYNQYRTTQQRDRQACFDAFLNNHRVGMVVFMGIALDYLLLG
jgi:4-hydroxybenzoate polyprenyltransferase